MGVSSLGSRPNFMNDKEREKRTAMLEGESCFGIVSFCLVFAQSEVATQSQRL